MTALNEVSGGSGKKPDADKHEDPKKDDHKTGADTSAHTSDATHDASADHSVGHLLSDAFGSALSNIKGAWDYLSSTGAGTESLPKVELTGAAAEKGKASRAGDQQTQTPSTPSADSFNFDTWWTKWRETEKSRDEKLPDSEKATAVAQYLGTDRGWSQITHSVAYESRDPHGGTDTTTISGKGTDHHMADGSVGHTDARGTVIHERNGMTVGSDAATGKTVEKMPNGTEIVHNKNGTIDVTRDGVNVHVNADGTIDQDVNGHHINVTKDRVDHIVGQIHFIQDRGHLPPEQAWKNAHAKTHDGKPAVIGVPDPEHGGHMVMVVNDGNGNTVDYYRNGNTVITSAAHPDTKLITNQHDHTIRVQAQGHDYWLQRQEGTDGKDRWYLYNNREGEGNPAGWIDGSGAIYKYDKDDPGQNGGLIGQLSKPVGSDGTLQQGTAATNTDASSTLTGAAKNVKIRQNDDGGTSATARSGDQSVTMTVPGQGQSSELTVHNNTTGKNDATTVNCNNGSYQTKDGVQVDQNGNAVTDSQGQLQGGTAVSSSKGFDAHDRDMTSVGLGVQDGKDQSLNVQYNENGEPSWHNSWDNSYWNEQGDLIDSEGNCLRDDGSVLYSDGTDVDPTGKVSYNGDTVYNSEENWDDGGASVAQVNAIIGIAASISSSGIADPGKVGQLLELYSQLGNVAGMALQAGDVSAFMQADLAKAVISGAISEQQAAEARTTLAQYFSNHPLNADEIAQVQHHMNGTSASEVQEFARRSGWTSDTAQV